MCHARVFRRAVVRLGVESGVVSVLQRAAVRLGRRVREECSDDDVSHMSEGSGKVLTVFYSSSGVARLGMVGVLGEWCGVCSGW